MSGVTNGVGPSARVAAGELSALSVSNFLRPAYLGNIIYQGRAFLWGKRSGGDKRRGRGPGIDTPGCHDDSIGHRRANIRWEPDCAFG
jgi:hypothetical protein